MPFRHQRTLILSRKERSPPLNQAFTINRFHLPFDFTDFQGEGGALRHLFQLFFLLGSPGSLLWMVFTREKVSNLLTKSLNHFSFCSLNSSYWIPELEIPVCFVCAQLLSLLSSWINDVAYVISKRRSTVRTLSVSSTIRFLPEWEGARVNPLKGPRDRSSRSGGKSLTKQVTGCLSSQPLFFSPFSLSPTRLLPFFSLGRRNPVLCKNRKSIQSAQ